MMWALLVLIGMLAWAVHLWQVAKKFKTIPGDLGFPIVGNFFKYIMNFWFTTYDDFHKYVDTLYKHGDICCFWFYGRVMVVVSDPDKVEKLSVHPSLHDKPEIVFRWLGWFFRNTITCCRSEKEWKQRRKELNLSLRKHNMQSYHATFVKNSNKLVKLFSTKSGQFDCMEETMPVAIETILSTHFGLNLDISNDPALHDILHKSSTLMASTLTNPILGLLIIAITEFVYYPNRQLQFENLVFQEVMKKVKEFNTDEADMKNVPLAAVTVLRNMDKNSSLRDYKRELVELIHAGAHTVGTATSSALVFLATNPHIQDKAWQEQEEIFGDSGRDATYDDISKMDYLERCIKETLRFVTPPLVFKESKQDLTIDGTFIPANTIVVYHSRRMRLTSKYWDNPMAFDPDRFLEENLSKVPKSASSLFGYGIRSCPGVQYGIYSQKMVLSTVLRNYKLNSSIRFNEIKYNVLIMPEIIGGYKISLERRTQTMPTNL